MTGPARSPIRPEPKPTLAVSMGDPLGIGPEVVVRALADAGVRRAARYVIHGSGDAMLQAAHTVGIDPFWWTVRDEPAMRQAATSHPVLLVDHDRDHPVPTEGPQRGPTAAGGLASFLYVERALEDAARPAADPLRVDGIVTAPISKKAWAMAGKGRWPGHTELLARRTGAKRSAMMFAGPTLNVVLATVHLPLMDIRNILTIGRVFDAIDLGNEGMQRLGVARPRIAVCGLNPHAGEDGALGDEEERLIHPAIELAVRAGIDVSGPFPGDTIFAKAVGPGRTYDLVVAMYHDQGLIPVKLLARDESVNVTLGLPTVRTSPDHGTAYDIAGRGIADPGSMRAACELAARLASPGQTVLSTAAGG